jgi:hypothetical protein
MSSAAAAALHKCGEVSYSLASLHRGPADRGYHWKAETRGTALDVLKHGTLWRLHSCRWQLLSLDEPRHNTTHTVSVGRREYAGVDCVAPV